jgi:hypothetical protein
MKSKQRICFIDTGKNFFLTCLWSGGPRDVREATHDLNRLPEIMHQRFHVPTESLRRGRTRVLAESSLGRVVEIIPR